MKDEVKRNGRKYSAQSRPPIKIHRDAAASSSFILPPSSLRILLWDIDGTLLRSVRPGAFKEYFAPMLEAVFGTVGCLPEMQVSGMTDLQIIAEALRPEGYTNAHIREHINDLRDRYMEAMRQVTGNGNRLFEVLPGVREVLAVLRKQHVYASALLTGNIEPAAKLKLELVGLSEYFTLPGAFGDESHDRRDLPALAAERIRKHLKLDLEPSQFIVIGDTPNDIACAQHFGARSLVVATSRMFSIDELRECNPDVVLQDFSDVNEVMETLASL